MVMDPRLPDWNKSNEPVVGFDSSVVLPLSIEMDASNNMRAISTDDLDGESVSPAEPDQISFYPSVGLGKNLNVGRESCSSFDDNGPSDPVLKHISQMLMEENMEEREWMGPDHLALRNIEKSLYDALGEQCPDLPDKFHNFDGNQLIGSMISSSLFGRSSNGSCVGAAATTTSCNNSIDPNWLHDPIDYNQAITTVLHRLDQAPQQNLDYCSPFHASSLSSSTDGTIGLVQSSFPVKSIFDDNDIVMQFKRGLEEGSRFLLPNSQLCITFENVRSDFGADGWIPENVFHGSFKRKNHGREDLGFKEVRVPKQVASYVEAEEAELLDRFDKVLLCTGKVEPVRAIGNRISTDASKDDLLTSARLHGSSGEKGRRRRRRNSNSLVDLGALLIMCAQAISSNDMRTSNELLKQIRENSSPSGDGFQRLAHHFANGIEARMAGVAQSYYATIVGKRRSAADMLKIHQLHLSSSPFRRLTYSYMNYMIWRSSQKATVLNIIDFGIGFGFHLPILIQMLGERSGGPPKLRITGIEIPQPGFRPAQLIEETGRRLARYCERFNVPFKYNAVPLMSWEAVKIEDLMIESGEMIAVNCSTWSMCIRDETAEEDSPRDTMLNLIRRIKPDIFVHAVINGSFNTPFFATRFREALFSLSSTYDMLDATISSEFNDSEERTFLESDLHGQRIMNVIACEGPERVVRPETYKQWQVRHERVGFKQLPLDRAMMKELRHKLEAWYHKDFVLDEDGDWMLLGWKGRIMEATTCWVPV